MLNGKFYTGLPEKMMNRTPNGVDRQRTNLYWPEEENSPSIYEYSPSRNVGQRGRGASFSRDSSSRTSSISYDSQNSFCDDVNTREMVRKQQESKIQFYDYDDKVVAPSRTITPSSVARNQSPEQDLAHRKLETLKSRIEFYDYVDAPPPTNGPGKSDAGKIERRSSATAASRSPNQLPRESETRPTEAVVVANKSRDSSNFIRETYATEDLRRTDGRSAAPSNGQRHRQHHDDDYENNNGETINHRVESGRDLQMSPRQGYFTESRRMPVPEERSRVQRPLQGSTTTTTTTKTATSSSSTLAKKQLSSSVIDLSALDLLDDAELEQLKKLKAPTKNDVHKKLATFQSEMRVNSNGHNNNSNNHHYDGKDWSPPQFERRPEQEISSHNHNGMRQQQRQPRAQPTVGDGGGGEDRFEARDSDRDRAKRVVTPQTKLKNSPRQLQQDYDPEPPNEARRMAHRHLHSSFSFGAGASSGNNDRRPISVRDSAVSRVGVGLPDL